MTFLVKGLALPVALKTLDINIIILKYLIFCLVSVHRFPRPDRNSNQWHHEGNSRDKRSNNEETYSARSRFGRSGCQARPSTLWRFMTFGLLLFVINNLWPSAIWSLWSLSFSCLKVNKLWSSTVLMCMTLVLQLFNLYVWSLMWSLAVLLYVTLLHLTIQCYSKGTRFIQIFWAKKNGWLLIG